MSRASPETYSPEQLLRIILEHRGRIQPSLAQDLAKTWPSLGKLGGHFLPTLANSGHIWPELATLGQAWPN